jgi:hypothetical protein
MGLRVVLELTQLICLLIRQRVVKVERTPIPIFPSVMRLPSVPVDWLEEADPRAVEMVA